MRGRSETREEDGEGVVSEHASKRVEENQECRIPQAPKEENISKKEGIFTCKKNCRGAKREMMETQLLDLVVRKTLVSRSRLNKDIFLSMRASPDKISSLRKSESQTFVNTVRFYKTLTEFSEDFMTVKDKNI